MIMKKEKMLGIWMDHAQAHLLDFPSNEGEIQVVRSDFTEHSKLESLSKGELHMHNKERQQQRHFYKNLAAIIKGYNEVLLFGPTEAKTELMNVLRADPEFASISIEVRQSDYITENQQRAFVKEFFSPPASVLG